MITPGVCDSFRIEQLDGLHLPEHHYFLALYGDRARLGPWTRAYTGEGEVEGDGYVPGGLALTGRRTALLHDVAILEFAPATWDPATITADGGLVYNRSRPSLPAIAVVRLAQRTTSTNGPFRVTLDGLLQWRRA